MYQVALLLSNMILRQFSYYKYYIRIAIIHCNRLETTQFISHCNKLETLEQQMYNSRYMTPLCAPIHFWCRTQKKLNFF